VSVFFLNYVMANVAISTPLLLWGPLWASPPKPQLPVSVSGHKSKEVQAATSCKRPPVHPDLPQECTKLGIILVLTLTYSVIAPALMPICLLFFALCFVVYGWLFLSVWTPESDCQGKCWFELFNTTMLGLILGTLSFTALAGTRSDGAFYALLVLCFIELCAWRGYNKYFAIPAHFTSLEDASTLDKRCGDARDMLDGEYYMDPVLKRAQVECQAHPKAVADAQEAVAASGCASEGPVASEVQGSAETRAG